MKNRRARDFLLRLSCLNKCTQLGRVKGKWRASFLLEPYGGRSRKSGRGKRLASLHTGHMSEC